MIRIDLAAPADQEALWNRAALVHLRLGHWWLAGVAGRLGHERQGHYRRPREVVACLLVGDVDQRLEAPLGCEHRQSRLHVYAMITRAYSQDMRFGGGQPGLEAAVHEQAPDLLVGTGADQILDVDAAIAQRPAGPIGLGDLGGEGDDALQA